MHHGVSSAPPSPLDQTAKIPWISQSSRCSHDAYSAHSSRRAVAVGPTGTTGGGWRTAPRAHYSSLARGRRKRRPATAGASIQIKQIRHSGTAEWALITGNTPRGALGTRHPRIPLGCWSATSRLPNNHGRRPSWETSPATACGVESIIPISADPFSTSRYPLLHFGAPTTAPAQRISA